MPEWSELLILSEYPSLGSQIIIREVGPLVLSL